MTDDVILTIGLLLVAGLAARAVADVARVSHVLLLVAAGALLGPQALDVVTCRSATRRSASPSPTSSASSCSARCWAWGGRRAGGDDLEPPRRHLARLRAGRRARVLAIGYVSLGSAGGSGYLGAFLAGVVVGNMGALRCGCTRSTSATSGASRRRSRTS